MAAMKQSLGVPRSMSQSTTGIMATRAMVRMFGRFRASALMDRRRARRSGSATRRGRRLRRGRALESGVLMGGTHIPAARTARERSDYPGGLPPSAGVEQDRAVARERDELPHGRAFGVRPGRASEQSPEPADELRWAHVGGAIRGDLDALHLAAG